MSKPILCVDFDGTIHPYSKGWLGPDVIDDEPVVAGFFEWLDEVSQHFDVQVYSSRSRYEGGVPMMIAYITEQRRRWRDVGGKSPNDASGAPAELSFPVQKPAAFATIDDRAITFEGTWPPLAQLQAFKPWNKR